VRDLDSYVDNHKRTFRDEFSTKLPAPAPSNQIRNGSRRAG
jgi:hypothetical protein